MPAARSISCSPRRSLGRRRAHHPHHAAVGPMIWPQKQPGHPPAISSGMTMSFKPRWQARLHGRPGQRFQDRYAAARKSRADASWAQRGRRALHLLAALVAIIIAVLLMFIPGPAVVFCFFCRHVAGRESYQSSDAITRSWRGVPPGGTTKPWSPSAPPQAGKPVESAGSPRLAVRASR